MRSTLFHIPESVGGIPLFGVGLLLAAWVLFCLGMVVWWVWRHGLAGGAFSNLPIYVLVAAAIALVLPALVESGQGLPIRSYGVMVLVGVVAGVGLAVRRARQVGLEEDFIFSLAFWMFAAGIVGARLFHVIEYWGDSYRQLQPDGSIDLTGTLLRVINVPSGGLVVYGSLIGGAIAMVWHVRRQGLPFLPIADLVAPCLVLGLAFGRIGCLLNGCCFGGPCDYAWAISFPQESLPYLRQVERGLLYGIQVGAATTGEIGDGKLAGAVPVIQWVRSDVARSGVKVGDRIVRFDELVDPTVAQVWQRLQTAGPAGVFTLMTAGDPREKVLSWSPPPRSAPMHPTQIYSSINALLLCLLLVAYYPLRRHDGEVFALLLTLYPITRFVLEIIRTDEMAVFGTQMSISQNVSILFLLGVIALWWYVLSQPAGKLWSAPRQRRRRTAGN
jgi:phosphatidylglycerol:prolipoprotein diacylglycerol transferase